jgi:hyperosmotically inducible periplasmic protein
MRHCLTYREPAKHYHAPHVHNVEMGMKHKLAMTCFVIGAALTPISVYAEDQDADRADPKTFVKDSAITAKIKTKLAAEHLASVANISVDTDKDGVVWMKGTVKDQAELDQAVRIAQNTEGVKTVKNGLKIQK